MGAREDVVRAIEKFISSKKHIVGADRGYDWGPGYSPHERKAKFSLDFGGELNDAIRFEVIGFPQAESLKFRLSLCFHTLICRLDYTDETHTNPLDAQKLGCALQVTGPHYHSWPLNRKYFLEYGFDVKLRIAKPFEMEASFDSILRWFCDDMNIDPLPADHLIELPRRERLL
jgi:hypothetical protein